MEETIKPRCHVVSDGSSEGTKIYLQTETGELDITRFCLGMQIAIKLGEIRANIYLPAPITDIVVEGEVIQWEELQKGYIAMARAEVAEELAFIKQGLTPEVQPILDMIINDIIEKKSRKLINEERKNEEMKK